MPSAPRAIGTAAAPFPFEAFTSASGSAAAVATASAAPESEPSVGTSSAPASARFVWSFCSGGFEEFFGGGIFGVLDFLVSHGHFTDSRSRCLISPGPPTASRPGLRWSKRDRRPRRLRPRKGKLSGRQRAVKSLTRFKMSATCSSNERAVVSTSNASSGRRKGDKSRSLSVRSRCSILRASSGDFVRARCPAEILQQATSCPRLESGDQEDLQVRVGEYHGAHVSAVCNEVSVLTQSPLGAQKPLPDRRKAGNDGYLFGHLRRPQLIGEGSVTPVDVHPTFARFGPHAEAVQIPRGQRTPFFARDLLLE